MITFLHPYLFLLLIPLAYLAYRLWHQDGHDGMGLFSPAVFARLIPAGHGETATRVRTALVLVAGLLAVVALSRPVLPPVSDTLKTSGSDIIVALDISRSMSATDIAPTRLAAAKAKIDALIAAAPHDRFGVIAFSRVAFIVSPLTADRENLAYALDSLVLDDIPSRGTDLGRVIDLAARLSHAPRKALILLTDGGDDESLQPAVTLAREKGVALFVIGTATTRGATLRDDENKTLTDREGNTVVSALHPDIEMLGRKTGGRYVPYAAGGNDALEIVGAIHDYYGRLARHSETTRHYRELFPIPLGLALLAWLASMAPRRLPWRGAVPLLLALTVLPSQAGMFDFYRISQGEYAYARHDYEGAVDAFGALAAASPSNEALYDYADALYKTRRYGQAIAVYKKIRTTDRTMIAHVLHNIGNAYAMKEEYDDARKAYTDALRYANDPQTRENLERIRHLSALKKGDFTAKKHGSGDHKDSDPSQAKQAPSGQGTRPPASPPGNGPQSDQNGASARHKNTADERVLATMTAKKPLSGRQIDMINKQGTNDDKPW